jgi:phosphorylcholine metabolism protein LicD
MIPYKLKYLLKKILFTFSKVFSEFSEFNSFPFNPELPLSDNKLNTLLECVKILKENKIHFRLTDGTILGIYRDHKLIEHDNDIDVDVIAYDRNVVDNLIYEFLKKKYTIGRIVFYKNKIQQIVFFNKNKDIFDILFWWEKENVLYNYSERGFVRSQEIIYFKNLSKINFLGEEMPAPSQLEKWLELRYGKDWRIPKTSKGDWKLECFDMEKI